MHIIDPMNREQSTAIYQPLKFDFDAAKSQEGLFSEYYPTYTS